MAVSRTNQKRKNKLKNYKDSLKAKTKKKIMNQEALKALPQIQQRPYWSSTEDIVIKGFEYEALVNVANIFREAVRAAESSLQRNIESGKINVKYFDQNEVELTKEQVDAIGKQYQEYFQQLQASEENQKRAAKSERDGQATKSLLVSAEGEPFVSESPLRVV